MDPESAELVSFPFKHCYNLTDSDMTAIALARGITSAVCGATSFVTLCILLDCYCHRVCGTVIKRLIVGLIAVNVPYQLVLALPLIHYFLPEQENFCKADGFFNQYLEEVEFLLTLAIGLVLFLKVCEVTTSWKCNYKDATFTCCGWKINTLETVLFLLVFCLPLLFDWIPFTTDSYGPFGPWCWIRRLENNCSVHRAGSIERESLAYAPFGSIVVLTLGLFIASLFLLGYAIKKAEKLTKVRIIDSVFFLALMLMLYILQSGSYFSSIHVALWMPFAISIPLTETLTPFVLLVAIHLLLSYTISHICCNCHGYTRTDSDQPTIRASTVIHQPSYTTWNSPHSTNTDSQTALLASDKELQKYGSLV